MSVIIFHNPRCSKSRGHKITGRTAKFTHRWSFILEKRYSVAQLQELRKLGINHA